MTGGMDNPVEVVFTPGGERIFTTTFLQHPGGGRRDGLIHAVYGGVYGKDHGVLEGHPRTSPDLMPVLTHLGPAAPCGLARYASDAFGDDYRDNLFATLFNMQKVTRHVLEPSGATFQTRDEDFLVCDDRDFHPTDVLEDADGSLLVIDTGGWYKLCCPTSQLWKPDVLGAIYRVRRNGTKPVDDPRGLLLTWQDQAPADLARLLDDPRPAVRGRAVQTLAERGDKAIPALDGILTAQHSSEARRNAVWAASRIDGEEARATVRQALGDPDETVRQVALHAVSLWRDGKALTRLLDLLKGASPANQRVAAEAIGRIGDPSAVPALLDALADVNDRVLEHSLTFALIEIADPDATAAGLKSPVVAVRRAALVALDQMEGGTLPPSAIAPNLGSPEAVIRETASWIAGHHPEWGTDLAGFLRSRLAIRNLPEAERDELTQQLARFSGAEAIQQLLTERLRDPSATTPERQIVLRAMARSGVKTVPTGWLDPLARLIQSDDPALYGEAVATARFLPLPKVDADAVVAALLDRARDAETTASVRLAALAAVPGGLSEVDPALFAFLKDQLSPDQAASARTAAADVLAKARLKNEQRQALTEPIADAGPLELPRLLAAFENGNNPEVGLKLVQALEALAGADQPADGDPQALAGDVR